MNGWIAFPRRVIETIFITKCFLLFGAFQVISAPIDALPSPGEGSDWGQLSTI